MDWSVFYSRSLWRTDSYRMDCKLCAKDESFYVGETRRSVRLRYNEHIRDAKNHKTDTPFGVHQSKHPGVQLDSSSILIQISCASKDGPDRKIWESIFIRDLKPTLNAQTSSWPLIWSVTWLAGCYVTGWPGWAACSFTLHDPVIWAFYSYVLIWAVDVDDVFMHRRQVDTDVR